VIDRGRHNVVGVMVNAVDYEMAVERVVEAARTREPLSLSALAVHGVMTGVMDDEQRYRLNHLDLVVPDGQPVRWALNWLYGAQLSDRVYGPNLMLNVCKRAAEESLPIYLYGSRPEVLEALQTNLLQLFPKLVIAGIQPSQFRQLSSDEKRAVVRQIIASGAMITFVGLGCPRQEVWAYEFRELLAMPLLAVGAAFDFHAGTLAQAPANMQRAGLEWLFRLGREPGRLWQRYVLLNPYYLFLLFLQWTHLKRFDPQTARQPTGELLYG
jgi:N-acetylglucosaminyldiphosphoundecaprenol N-acetyl-beta-D-mannosaminyltransferase